MEPEQQNEDIQQKKTGAYKSILKGTAVFGGVQVINILINLIRGKLVASFLGPVGMGISALLSSTINTVQQFSLFGINFSAINDISKATNQNDGEALARTAQSFKILILLSALLSALIFLLAAPWLSDFAFKNREHVTDFRLLSIAMFFIVLGLGESALLQGSRRLKHLATTSILGALIGLLVGTPLYYWLGTRGIVPAIIVLAVITYLCNKFYSSRIPIIKVSFDKKEFVEHSKKMLSLGFILMISSLIGTIATYLVNAFISRTGSVQDVGLFQSAASITNQYVGLVFSAMAIDYLPRLAQISDNREKVNETVNNQSEIVLLIVVPLLSVMIVSAPLIIRILLTREFMVIEPILKWMGLGILFKAAAFPIGYISFAKGDKKVFFWFEGILMNFILMTTNMIAYKFYGLYGLGISFVVTYAAYYIIVYSLARYRYQYAYNKDFFKMFLFLGGSLLLIFLLSIWSSGLVFLALNLVILTFIIVYCVKQLDKRIQVISMIKSKFWKKG